MCNPCQVLAVSTVLMLATSGTLSAQTTIVDPQLLQQLQETIRKQQQQLQQQAEQIKAQSEVLQNLQQQINALQPPAPTVTTTLPPPSSQTIETTVSKTPSPHSITSGNNKIKLAISGQINRAVVVMNDGQNTTLYHVDNTASNSRIRFIGTAKAHNDLTIATRIEVAISPDRSSQVSQQQKFLSDTYFDQRWVELSLESKTFGKLSLGKGDTASNTTAEIDLSKTDVVQYASIADMGGGFLFREKRGAQPLTTTQIADSFKSLDGLTRQSRLRYDSPRLLGFQLAGSLVSGQRSDLSLFWSGQGHGLQSAGAFAVANPQLDDTGLQYDGSFSTLHTASGLNLTLSGGLQERDNRQDATNLYVKLGWLTNLSALGHTAFGVDYTRSEHMAAAGDKAYSVGAAIVQAFEKIATELYLQYRIYSLDRANGAPVANIHMGTFGARVKF